MKPNKEMETILTSYNFSNKQVYQKQTTGYMIDDNGKYHAYVHHEDDPDMVYMTPFDDSDEALKEAARIVAESHAIVPYRNTRGFLYL